MKSFDIVRLSAIAPQIVMKPFFSSRFSPVRDGGANHRKVVSRKEAFCISGMVALPALSVGTSQLPERTDERNHSGASRGRSVISQDAQDVGVKGLNHAATVLHVRDVAGAYSPEPTMKLNAGTANRTVIRIGFNPKPLH